MGSGIAQGFNIVEACRGDDGDGALTPFISSSPSSPTVTGGLAFHEAPTKGLRRGAVAFIWLSTPREKRQDALSAESVITHYDTFSLKAAKCRGLSEGYAHIYGVLRLIAVYVRTQQIPFKLVYTSEYKIRQQPQIIRTMRTMCTSLAIAGLLLCGFVHFVRIVHWFSTP